MFLKCAKAGKIIEWSTLQKIPQEVQDNTVFIKRQVIKTCFSRVQKFNKVYEICRSSPDPKIFNVFINFKNLVICNIRKRGTSFLSFFKTKLLYIYIYIYIYIVMLQLQLVVVIVYSYSYIVIVIVRCQLQFSHGFTDMTKY